jgi:HSP20 family protein
MLKEDITMAIVRWNPRRELALFPTNVLSMQREINRMFDDFFRSDTDEASLLESEWKPAVDITEEENAYVAKVEIPGVEKEDVKITLQDNVLTIRGEKKAEKKTKDASMHRVERYYGSFQRSFSLPTSVRSDAVGAEYKDGILTVVMPKAEVTKPKQIEVKVK